MEIEFVSDTEMRFGFYSKGSSGAMVPAKRLR